MTSLFRLDPNSDEPRLDAASVRLLNQSLNRLTPVERLEVRLVLAEQLQAPQESGRLIDDPTRKA